MLCIELFGAFHLTDAQVGNMAVGSERSQSLLAYLLLHRHSPQPRQQIAAALWPDMPETEAKTSLRRELYRLKQTLPGAERYLSIQTKTLQWLPKGPFQLDVAEFEEALTQGADSQLDASLARSHLEQAIRLYRGELLPTCYDDWIMLLRERFHQQAMLTLDRLIQITEQQHDYAAALPLALRLLQLDPLHELGYQALMRSHQGLGDRAAALKVYHQCMTTLRDELGIDPSPATQQLYHQALTAEPSSSPSSPSSPPSPPPSPSRSSSPPYPLLGRAAERQTLQTWLSTDNTALLLIGEPGIGKTRLLEELTHMVQATGGRVLQGRGFEAELLRPYGAWIDALRSLPSDQQSALPPELGVLLPELGPSCEPLADRGRLFDGVIGLLHQTVIAQPPLVMVFDDIQWLDDASVSLLHYALRLLRSTPVRFAFSARRQELQQNPAVATLIQTLRRDQHLRDLDVGPLDHSAILALIRTVDGSMNGDRIFHDSGGNPLFALEAVRALHHQGRVDSSTLQALIADRLKNLADSAQTLLPWAAAIGRQFAPDLLAQVANCPLPELLTALEQLEAANILRPSLAGQNRYDFAHDVVRQVVYASISAPRQCLMHRQIAQHLAPIAAATPDLIGEVARHASLGQHHELAAQASLAAAQQGLQLFAYEEVAELAQQGLSHCAYLEPKVRFALELPLLKVQVLAGVDAGAVPEIAQALQTALQAAQDLGLSEAEASGLEALLVLNYHHNRLSDLHHHSLQAAERGHTVHPSHSARVLAISGACLTTIERDMNRAEALLLEAQALARRGQAVLPDIACGLGIVARFRGNLATARQQFAAVYALLETAPTDDPPIYLNVAMALSHWAMAELEAHHWDAAIVRCRDLQPLAQKLGQGSEVAFGQALEALARYAIDPAQAESHAALTTAAQTLHDLDAPRKLAYIYSGAAEIDLSRNRPEIALNHANAATAAARVVAHPSDVVIAWSLLVRAQIATAQPDKAHRDWPSLKAFAHGQEISHRAAQTLAAAAQLFKTTVAPTY
ncbi:MAG: BTAD domain-containing putative transcriptional regulator [Nodosilinea sp.]